jgi:RNA polymerase sigma factor (TIGR02999 family)
MAASACVLPATPGNAAGGGDKPAFITQLLADWSRGNHAALAELTPRVHRELHAIARGYLGRGRATTTLQPTALINETYLRLIGGKPVRFENRSHFFGIAARLMRLILVDHVRACRAARRGGGWGAVTLEDAIAFAPGQPPDVIDVDMALRRLAEIDERKAKVVELRYFGGMSREEIAAALSLTVPTVKRDLRLAEAWLRQHLTRAN